ncbi:17389_t:CDS:1, partial [Acaulospora morrowiae]
GATLNFISVFAEISSINRILISPCQLKLVNLEKCIINQSINLQTTRVREIIGLETFLCKPISSIPIEVRSAIFRNSNNLHLTIGCSGISQNANANAAADQLHVVDDERDNMQES